jgi:hypothetical protein
MPASNNRYGKIPYHKQKERDMKKVINGKVCDTEAAECVGDWSNGCNYGDFDQCSESLYKTKKGQFFTAGSGGARSKYSRSCGTNSVGGGEGIELLSEAEALTWCEEHDVDADVVAKYFKVQEG